MTRDLATSALTGGDLPVPGGGDDPISGVRRTDSVRSATGSQFLVEAILSDLDDDLFFNF